MDIVYLVKHDPENNSEELRYSLRSLKNIPHDKVVIIGEKPDWVTNITFIPVPQTDTKKANVAKNLRTAVDSELVSDNFLLMNDDFFFMKPLSEMPNINFGLMQDVINQYNLRYPEGSDYITSMIDLHKALIEAGYENPISYELHTPMHINKHIARSLFTEVTKPLYQFRTYYGNYAKLGGETVSDVKIFMESGHNSNAYNTDPIAYLEDQILLSVTGGSFKRGIPGKFVKSKFLEPSIYELQS